MGNESDDWFLFLWGILIGMIILMMGLASLGKAPLQLKEEIYECQNKIPSCNIEDGYWGFRATCDYWDWRIVDKHHYESEKDCQEGIESWFNAKGCEVLNGKDKGATE